MFLTEYLSSICTLSRLKKFGEITQFSQLLIQGLVDHFADFSGFSPFPASSLFTGISTERQEREVKGEGTPLFYFFLVNDLLGRLKLFAKMRIMCVSE